MMSRWREVAEPSLLSPFPSFHNYLLCSHYTPGACQLLAVQWGMKHVFLILGEQRPHEQADHKQLSHAVLSGGWVTLGKPLNSREPRHPRLGTRLAMPLRPGRWWQDETWGHSECQALCWP